MNPCGAMNCRLFCVIVLLLLTACSATPNSTSGPSDEFFSLLPTVTPILTETANPAVVVIELATPEPPTPTPGVRMSASGPVTASMDQLGLSGAQVSTLGNPDAPITIVEFSDFGCRFCRTYNLFTFEELRREYIDSGQVYYVFKHLPVTSQQGGLAAEAAECAGEQGRFWEYHDALFREPERWDRDETTARQAFATIAGEQGLEVPALETCLSERRYQAKVEADLAEGHSLRLFGTPNFFINGRLLSGAQPFEVFSQVLDDQLAR